MAELLTGCKVILNPPHAGTCVDDLKPDYVSGILLGAVIFLVSCWILKIAVGGRFEGGGRMKMYLTGAGSYVLLYIFVWTLTFTLGVAYLNL